MPIVESGLMARLLLKGAQGTVGTNGVTLRFSASIRVHLWDDSAQDLAKPGAEI
jgi:hypothetical protein